MAGMPSDLDVLKDIPGYKAILKSVLKSQIQLLIEQLSDHTGEETIILTASIHDGTLSHLGSLTGKGFLDGRDEIKSQFLAFCLKSHHKKKTSEARTSPYQRPQSVQSDRITPSQGLAHKRPRLQPVSLQRAGTGDSPGNSFSPPDIHRAPSQALSTNGQDSSSVNVKLESSEQSVSSTESTNFVTTSVSLPTSIQLSHTQTSAEPGISDTSEAQNDDDFTEQGSENEDSAATSIKIEPITENEMELEITGVEPGKASVAADSWSQVPGTIGVGDGAANETGDQTGYRVKYSAHKSVTDVHVDKGNEIKRKQDFSHKLSVLKIPGLLKNDYLFDEDSDLIEREVRNPLPERPVFVKSEPIDKDAVDYSNVERSKDLLGMKIDNAVFMRNKYVDEHIREWDPAVGFMQTEKVLEESVSQKKCSSEAPKEDDISEWKTDMFRLKQTGKYTADRIAADAEGTRMSKTVDSTKQPKRVFIRHIGDHSNSDGSEGEWKRTVIVGKPRKQAKNKRKITIKDYVGEILSGLRNKAENQNKTTPNSIDSTGEEKRKNKAIDKLPVGCEEDTFGVGNTGNNYNNERRGKKRKCKESKGFQDRELDTFSKTRLKSPKDRGFGKSTLNSPGFHRSGHPNFCSWKHGCSYCPMIFASEIALKQHIWRHTKVKPFVCSYCAKGFIRMRHLHWHMHKEHQGLQY